jgi:hypothetical protein
LCLCLSLDLSSSYERKHEAFAFLILANFTQHYVLQFYSFTFKLHVIISCGWVIFHYICIFLDPFIVVGHPSGCQSLAIVNSAGMNIG